MKKISTMALFSILGLFACQAHNDLTVEAFRDKLAQDGKVQLLDVRTPQEFADGHLPGALNIDWLAGGFADAAKASLESGREVMVYCRSGRRSASAAAALEKLGFTVYNMKGGINAWKNAGFPVTTYEVERFCTPAGAPVEITLIKHASLAICYKGISFQIDPVTTLGQQVTDYASFPKPRYVLVTHEHGDHFDKEAIALLGGQVVTNTNCARMLGDPAVKALSNGESLELEPGIHLDAVPAYNTTEGHLQFHPKGRDNGFILDLDGFRIYIAGDTEDIPEMAEIKNIDVAFLPCNQPYTMTPEQCINAARTVKPKVLIPYHFGQTDVSGLPAALPGIEVRLRKMQ